MILNIKINIFLIYIDSQYMQFVFRVLSNLDKEINKYRLHGDTFFILIVLFFNELFFNETI